MFSVPGTTKIGLGKRATVYDAEMLALAITGTQVADLAHNSLQAGSPISEVRIYSDSTSALINIMDPSPHPGQVFSLSFINNIKKAWLTIPSLQIFLNWSPGHADVIGNEAADREARAATSGPGFTHPTLVFLKKKTKIRIRKVWQRTVKKSSPGTAFINHYHPNPNPSSIFLGTPREVYGRVSQTLSGHGYTGEYYAKMKIPESPWCLCLTSVGAPVYNNRLHIL